jgi:hypothetical protein
MPYAEPIAHHAAEALLHVATRRAPQSPPGKVSEMQRRTSGRDVPKRRLHGMLRAMNGPIIRVTGTGSFCHALIAS